jgi:hypothetical protein
LLRDKTHSTTQPLSAFQRNKAEDYVLF